MKNLLLLFSAAFLLLIFTGCGANVRTYTLEIDRSDQNLEGNRGYIHGTPPSVKRSGTQKKRTIVGVDIELPTREEFIEETGLKIKQKK